MRRDAEAQVEVEALLHAQPHAVHVPRAGQVLLGQRRPVVGRVRLVADEG